MASRSKGGRPLKLTPAAILRVCEALRVPLPLSDCAETVPATYEAVFRRGNPRSWYSLGAAEAARREKDSKRDTAAPRLSREDLEGLAKLPDAALPDELNQLDRLYLAFFDEVTRALAEGKLALVGRIALAGTPHRIRKHTRKSRDVMVGKGENRHKVTLVEETEVIEEGVFDWRADAWLAERRWPADFAAPSTKLPVDMDELSDEQLAALEEGESLESALAMGNRAAAEQAHAASGG